MGRLLLAILILALLPGCGALSVLTKLSAGTKTVGVGVKSSKAVGAVKVVGTGAAVGAVAHMDDPIRFSASKLLEGVDALSASQEFIQWATQQPKAGRFQPGEGAPQPVGEAFKRNLPEGKPLSVSSRFSGKWAQRYLVNGEQLVAVYSSGEFTELRQVRSIPERPWSTGDYLLNGLGLLIYLSIAGWAILLAGVWLDGGDSKNLGAIAPQQVWPWLRRLPRRYVQMLLSIQARNDRQQPVVIWFSLCLCCPLAIIVLGYYYFWGRIVASAPRASTAQQLGAVDWSSGQLLTIESKAGVALARAGDYGEIQQRVVDGVGLVVRFPHDHELEYRQEQVTGYTRPVPPEYGSQSPTVNGRPPQVGMLDVIILPPASSFSIWWILFWSGLACLLFPFFWRGFRGALAEYRASKVLVEEVPAVGPPLEPVL